MDWSGIIDTPVASVVSNTARTNNISVASKIESSMIVIGILNMVAVEEKVKSSEFEMKSSGSAEVGTL